MNHKGFTLVELIAMITVLSILMVLVIPNIAGILKDNRESKAVEDVHLMISGAKTKLSTNKAYPKKEKDCVLMTLDFIDTNQDIVDGAYGGKYDRDDSFVVVKKEKEEKEEKEDSVYKYKYYFNLVEQGDENNNYIFGLDNNNIFIEYDKYSKNPTSPVESKNLIYDLDNTYLNSYNPITKALKCNPYIQRISK